MNSPIIQRIVVGDYKVNCYLLSCPATLETVIIDPGGEPGKILEMMRRQHLKPVYLLNTHGHGDHGLATAALRQNLSIPLGMHRDEIDFFSRPENIKAHRKELGLSPSTFESGDLILSDNQELPLGEMNLKVLHTPGHSPGSVCFYLPGHLFTGDTLFVGDVGRTDLTGGNLETLLVSIKDRILPLPAETEVHPP